MAAIVPRIFYDNQALKTLTTVNASSEQASFPVERVRDSRRSKTWRSLEGFIVQTGVNDAFDFNDGGNKTAIITGGVYVTGAQLATELQTKINAVAATPWTVTYLGSFKFVFIESTGLISVTFQWQTGANAAQTIGALIGFDTSADDVVPFPVAHQSDFAVQKSLASVVFDIGATPPAIDAAMAFETEVSGTGALKVQGNATNFWTAPTFETTLITGDPRDPRKYLDFFSTPQTFRYWRFLWDDANNPEFAEMGVPILAAKVEFEQAYNLNLPENRRVLSEITEADQGAIFTDIKPSPREWGFRFRDTSDADYAKWEAIEASVKVGQHLVYALDPLNNPLTHTIYGYVRNPGITFNKLRTFTDPTAAPEGHWDVDFPFSEAVG